MADDDKEKPQKFIDLNDQNPTVAVISILGQHAKFPINQSLVFIIIVLVIGLVSIEKISQGVSKTAKAVIAGNYQVLSDDEPEGGDSITARAYMFWTPGTDTWKDVVHSCHEDKKCLKDIQQWKDINFVTHNDLEAFGKALKNDLGLKGYTRFSVVGAGSSSGDKSGWWWRIIVENDELDKDDFLKTYKKYFKRNTVKLEESIIGA